VKLRALVVPFLLAITLLSVVGTFNRSQNLVSTVAATICSLTANLSSSTIAQGTASMTFSGTDTCDTSGTNMQFIVFGPKGSSCPNGGNGAANGLFTLSGSSFGPITINTGSFAPGFYCVYVSEQSNTNIVFDPLTVTAAAIPEYPLGLPILAILTIFAYGAVRRKAITIQK